MACFYAMEELGVPFKEETYSISPIGPFGVDDEHSFVERFYTLRVCKECRATWMEALQAWFNQTPAEEFPTEPDMEANIPVRINGSVRFLTEKQYFERYPEKSPEHE